MVCFRRKYFYKFNCRLYIINEATSDVGEAGEPVLPGGAAAATPQHGAPAEHNYDEL
jgi:hypothetical protein